MRLHILEHVPFESPACILDWAQAKGLAPSRTRLYETSRFPDQDAFDMLVILGGPMGVYEEDAYPWLRAEKRFLHDAILSDKKILGICLGAQLLASVLGADVRKNPEKEIGWFPVRMTGEGRNHPLFQDISETFTAFHWHGDTFDIPDGGIRIAASEACDNQGFIMNGHILGLQFHLESTPESVESLLRNCGNELVHAPWIQDTEIIRNGTKQHARESNRLMAVMLDRWIS